MTRAGAKAESERCSDRTATDKSTSRRAHGRHYGRQQLRTSFKADEKLLTITIEVQLIP